MTDEAADKMAKYMARASAAAVQAAVVQASQSVRGFVCPQCRCNNFAVDTTRRVTEGVRRYRVCRCCGYKMTTLEISETG